MIRKKTDLPGWVYVIDQGEVGPQPVHKKIVAGDADLKAIALRLDIPTVSSLSAELVLQRAPGNKAVIHVSGMLKSDVTQSCIVSGSPVKAHIEEEFEAWYADPASFTSIAKAKHDRAGKASADVEVPIMDEKDDPEPIIGGKIDLGDLVCQYLSLGLDPYPRAHGVTANLPHDDGPEGSNLRKNPFAALKDWKGGKKG